jgi:uncharacterized DUF497 family protein
MKLTFEWDANKEKTNIKKHGVSFVDAKTAFHDEYAMQFYDPDHSDDEDRFILLGTNHQLKTLVICHCFRQTETVIRIISARHADASEQAAYWSNRP